jgi:trehalose synthase
VSEGPTAAAAEPLAARGRPLVQEGRLLRGPRPRVQRQQRRRHRRPRRPHRELDYLSWLGVDCLWLLPFYESPLRDGGYDIADFFNVLPEYGTIGDAAHFLEEAHRHGIRVIADMVMNHTSDAHPWFQESRLDRTNPKADWYVWSDDDSRWSEARIIFTDTEVSNWTFDPVRGQYYWHRFFHHQPDLNYDNPEVAEGMLDVVRFWLDLGLDGFRLDAVPYLFERDGTNGENLKETHDYLKRLRKEVDASHPGKVILAEANQWPPTSSTTSGTTATSATCASTSRSCRACTWRCGGRSATRSPRSSPRRRPSPTTASGGSSSGTTTS